MGIMTTVAKIAAKPTRHGGHSLAHGEILNPCADAFNPTTAINWKTNNPKVLKAAKVGSVKAADQAEKEAGLYEIAVNEGNRIMLAEGRRHEAHAKLVLGHRVYQARVAQSQFDIAAANRAMAGKMHGLREGYANLGYGLDRKAQTVEQQIELTAAKYGAVH
jgi:hypothetical protein